MEPPETIAETIVERFDLERPLAFLDLETTGRNPATDRIVEIAVLRVEPDGSSTFRVRRLNPQVSIPASATAVHGISDADVADEPVFSQVAKSLGDFLDGCDLAGFNLRRFDLPLLQEEFARAGAPLVVQGRAVIDMQSIFHTKEPRDLTAAYSFYCGKEHEGAHGAAADTLASAEILVAQLERYDDLPADAAGLHEFCRDPTWVDEDGKFRWSEGDAVFGFGQYRDVPLRQVSEEAPDYLEWMLDADFSEEVRSIVQGALDGSFPSPDETDETGA